MGVPLLTSGRAFRYTPRHAGSVPAGWHCNPSREVSRKNITRIKIQVSC
jgi:hypothetical protein